MKTASLLLSLLVAVALSSGCVTGATIAGAKDHVTYKPKWSEGVIIGSEVDTVDKGKPGYYTLVPFAAAADVALAPVYVGVIIAVNTGIMSPP